MILVTGSTGLVGTHLLLELVKKHDKIRATHRTSSNLRAVYDTFALYVDDPGIYYDKIEWIEADVADFDTLIQALDGVDYVYHTAAFVSFDPRERQTMIRINVGGTANLVNACLERKVKKLCYVSSTAALGNAPSGEQITEDMIWSYSKNRSSYSVSKYQSEMEIWRGMAEGLQAVIVNPSIIIGPGDWKRSSSYLFSAVWKGMKFYTEGVTGYVDIRDVVYAMITLMDGDFISERFTLSAENLSYRQVFEMIAFALDKHPPRFHATPLLISLGWRLSWLISKLNGEKRIITRDTVKSSKRKALFSNEKIRQATGIDFIPIKQSVRDTANHFLNHARAGKV
jgi:nucleoside-diphosphate-sugar epimerase